MLIKSWMTAKAKRARSSPVMMTAPAINSFDVGFIKGEQGILHPAAVFRKKLRYLHLALNKYLLHFTAFIKNNEVCFTARFDPA